MSKKLLFIAVFLIVIFSFAACNRPSRQAAGDDSINWPRNISIVVPAAPGGDTDFNARTLAAELNQRLPPNFVVANVSGAGGSIAMRQVRDASPDGSSVAFYHTAFVINELSGTTDFGFEAYEFASIAAKNPGNAVTVRSNLGIRTLQELYDYTQRNPGQLRMAVQFGATSFAVGSMMQRQGFNVNIVEAGSAAERLMALLCGHVDIILAGFGSVADYITSGELVALAMDGGNDLVVGDIQVPSLVSAGYNIQLPFYYFFAFPPGTDRNLVNAFNAALADIIMNNPSYATVIHNTFFQEPTFFGTEEGLAIFRDIRTSLDGINFRQ